MGIDEVTFHKRTPLASDKSKLSHLMQRGAKLAVDDDVRAEFEKLGHEVSYEAREALERATVVLDCTPAGNENKELYEGVTGPKGFLAQGSEFGFGKPYARGVNDEVQVPEEDRFVQVVSCNTHNITTLIKTLCDDGDQGYSLRKGTFVCMRRSNDISQSDSFVPAPNVGKHDDPDFGTHHARDAHYVFETLGLDLNLFSSAVKLNTQYMHSIWFNLQLNRDTTLEEVKKRFRENPLVATTDKRYANLIFSFGRDHGYYGRILSQTVVVSPTLAVRRKREVYGFCFTPQDGNSLLSSIAATLWLVEPGDVESVGRRLEPLRRWLYREI
jgi:glyceraldehyde-3-phosphate dehydrogenase (NAD(P))